ncbi:MAG: DUF4259 domain-containing protein [Cyanobacteria bacterium SZAS LIN-2]|nr:DUF4259 domain-containing protein [Cyanobacteria bacterium SZAS LIN-2]
MGAWGCGSFENDGALDWLDQFQQKKSIKLLERKIATYNKAPETADEVIACAEIVAALNGYPGDDLPADLEEWSEKQRSKMPPQLAHDAAMVVASILQNSELNDLWAESPDYQQWIDTQQNLIERLNKKPPESGTAKVRKAPLITLTDSTTGRTLKLRTNQKLPDLNTAVPGLGPVRHVQLELGQDILPSEFQTISDWLKTRPEISLNLTDHQRKSSFRLDPANLKYFSWARNLDLQTETAPSLEALTKFDQLQELRLRLIKAVHPLEALSNHAQLRDLDLYCIDSKNLIEDIQVLNTLRNLKNLSITEHAFMKDLHKPDATATADLDLSSLSRLRQLSLNGIALRSVAVPQELLKIELKPGNEECRLRMPEAMPHLLWLSAETQAIRDQLPKLKGCKTLMYLSLRNVKASVDLSLLSKLPDLQCLSITLEGGMVPDLSAFHNLRFLSVFNLQGSDVIQKISAAPRLEAATLGWGEPGNVNEVELDAAQFDHFRDHPTLKSLHVSAMTGGGQLNTALAERLRLSSSLEDGEAMRKPFMAEISRLTDE